MKTAPSLGNPTLLRLSVKREAQNKAFSIKRKLIMEHSNLSFNMKLIALDSWDETTIAQRGALLADAAVKIYPR